MEEQLKTNGETGETSDLPEVTNEADKGIPLEISSRMELLKAAGIEEQMCEDPRALEMSDGFLQSLGDARSKDGVLTSLSPIEIWEQLTPDQRADFEKVNGHQIRYRHILLAAAGLRHDDEN